MNLQRFVFAAFAALVSHPVLAGELDSTTPPNEVTLVFGDWTARISRLGSQFAPVQVANNGAGAVGRVTNSWYSDGEGTWWRRSESPQSILGRTTGISWDGKAVSGTQYQSPGQQVFRNDAGSGSTFADNLGFGSPPFNTRNAIDHTAISGNGKVVVGSDSIYGSFVWTNGQTPVTLPNAPWPKTAAPTATSFDGSVIAGTITGDGSVPPKTVLWTKTASGYSLQNLPLSRIVGVTGDGKAVIGADTAGNAIRWQADTGAVPLGFKLGTVATMTADGKRILSSSRYPSGFDHNDSRIWDASFGEKSFLDYVTHDLGIDYEAINDAFGFVNTGPDYNGPLSDYFALKNAILSPDGLTFAGLGNNDSSIEPEGFVLTLTPTSNGPAVPEPSTLAIAGLIACGILFRKK